ncbi:DUF4268 domain-containing protein [Parapedobacter sp. 10938]|uniref:DUF4268 domain-containing protein n=1 Tax=Parapedobacter flavus TaxID=3110225 RepID=UPI002DB6FCDA|nr:DUF4268 domain-containing protein [Parapedobacter sp. 10938]MEC3881022.1 DUF4268 domain-containing protein [Parapedobacter sp. 10938]
MKANELQVISFLQKPNVQFVIPVYQRNYDWTETECKQLFKDVKAVEKEDRGTHFIGSIVFIHEGVYTTDNLQELVIIDGQQRLTTINILYVALYRFAKENDQAYEADRLYNMFLINQYVQDEKSKLKLKQTDENSKAFKAILNGTERHYDGYSNVIENYNYFRSVINSDNFETILRGLNRLIFVEISLERGKDDPQRIFESLNSTGLELSQSDLIRNYILMDLAPKRQREVFETIWNPIEENIRDVQKQTSLVSDFIRDYLTLRNKKIPNKSKVYEEFKLLHFDKNSESFGQELELIKSFSVHYKKFINPSTVAETDVRKELEYINRLEINVAYPFLLQVFEDAENGVLSRLELINVLQLIQSYAWRRFVAGYPTNALNKIFMTLYSEVDADEYYESVAKALLRKKGSGKFPTDEEVKAALKDKDLYNIKAKNRSYLFELLENHNNREWVDTSNERITVEHIFPQTPGKSWKSALAEEDFFLFSEKYLNTIANLTLSGNNGSLGNKSFLDKKDMNIDGKEQGYRYSRLWLNTYLNSIDSWGVSSFENRFEQIYLRFLNIWPHPDVEVQITEASFEEQTIFDAESPRYKKLEYFIFEDTKVEEETVAQMYFYVIKQLYERNPQLLVEHQDVFKVTRELSDFRSPQEIANGWYVESNIDSDTKFSVLKKLLTLFGMEDELLIQYAADSSISASEASRHRIRKEFWKQLLPQIKDTRLFANVNPTKDHWLTAGAGISGLGFTLVVTKSYARIELAISTSSKEANKRYFYQLYKNKSEIENAFGEELVWEELPDGKMSRIKAELQGVSLYNENDWEAMNVYLILRLSKFESVFRPNINKLKKAK